MATIKKIKKAQMGSSVVNPYAKMAMEKMKFERDSIGPKLSPAKISVTEKQVGAQKEKAKKAVTSPVRPLKIGGKIKKAQKGMTMKQLIKKYPGTDTTSRGDVRGSEMNSGAPKKVLDKYNDTYDAFERKSKEAPKAKPAKKSMKMGGKVKKAQNGMMNKAPINRTPINRTPKSASPSSGPTELTTKGPYKFQKNVPSIEQMNKDFQKKEREITTRKPGPNDRVNLKKGGMTKKKMNMGGMMKKGGKMSKSKKC